MKFGIKINIVLTIDFVFSGLVAMGGGGGSSFSSSGDGGVIGSTLGGCMVVETGVMTAPVANRSASDGLALFIAAKLSIPATKCEVLILLFPTAVI